MSDQKKGASIYALIEPGSLVKADEGQQAIFSSIKHLTAVKGGSLVILPELDRGDHPCWKNDISHDECQRLCDRYNVGHRWL